MQTAIYTQFSPEEIERRGEEIYENRLRKVVEEGNKGKLLVINVETGEYEIDVDDVLASRRASARFPEAPLYALRIGYPSVYFIGSSASLGLKA